MPYGHSRRERPSDGVEPARGPPGRLRAPQRPVDGSRELAYHSAAVLQIFGTPKCSHTRAARRFFADRRLDVQFDDLREKGLSKGELASVARAVGGMRALFDAGSARAKDRGLQHLGPDEARLAVLLAEDALLLRTPIVRDGQRASVGEAEEKWKAFAESAKPR